MTNTGPWSNGSKPSKPPFAFGIRTRLALRVMKWAAWLAKAIAPWIDPTTGRLP